MTQVTIDELFSRWRSRPASPLAVEEYRNLGKLANAKGENLLAFDIVREGLGSYAGDKVLRQLMSLALARMGSLGRSRQILEEIRSEGNVDEETLGLIARTYKDAWLRSGSTQDLKAAFEAYLEAYRGFPEHYWTGINAATLAFALQDRERSSQLASEVLASCEELINAGTADYWLTATVAEAELLLDRIPAAKQRYEESRAIGSIGDLLSTWRNASIILRLRPNLRQGIEAAFRPPKVAVLAGGSKEEAQQLLPRVAVSGVGIAYASAGVDGTMAFLEAVRSAGGQIHIVLPFNEADFVREQVELNGDDWGSRYTALRTHAEEVIVCSEQKFEFAGIGSEYANGVTYGLAKLRARELGTELISAGAPGGRSDNSGAARPGLGGDIRAIIFADAFHFSRLSERQLPDFVTNVLNPIATLIRNSEPKPEYQNTWGDGLFFVFEDVGDAGRFALQLTEIMRNVAQQSTGLPEDLALRIGMHAGPVYRFADQISDRENYLGWHVNRAARIEPVTPAGAIYVTDAFAALAVLNRGGDFRFDYVGRLPLAKNFGDSRIFELRARI